MKNIEIIRGYRSFGHEDVYASNPAVEIVEGDIVDNNGALVTLLTAHLECGMAIERNMINGQPKESGKTPVYVSNFVVRIQTSQLGAGAFDTVNTALSVAAGKLVPVDVTNTIPWGYITGVNTDGTIDVRCNY